MFTNNNNQNLFPNNNTTPNLFNNNANNNPTGNFMNNAQNQQQRNIFGGNNPTNTTPIFGNNAGNTGQGMNNNMFGNNNMGGNNMGGGIFNNQNTNTGNTMFQGQGNTNFNTNTGGNLFNTGNNMGGNNIFGNQNQNPLVGNPNPMFPNNNNTMGNPNQNMFTTNNQNPNQWQTNPNYPNNPNPYNYNPYQNPNQNPNPNNWFNTMQTQLAIQKYDYSKRLEQTKLQLDQCIRRLDPAKLNSLRLDDWNIYKDKTINSLPFLKERVLNIMYNFQELEKRLKVTKQANNDIEKKMGKFCQEMRKKVTLYKKCLLQTVSQNKLIDQLNSQINSIYKQIQQNIIPAYTNLKSPKKIAIKQPNQFDLKVSMDVLNKLQLLNQRVDDMIACESTTDDDVENSIAVFQQLIQYYQNVSCRLKDFTIGYKRMRDDAIRKVGQNPETVMSKVRSKVEENLKNQFKYYDMIKQIDQLLGKKEEREKKKRLDNMNEVTSGRRMF